MENKNTQWKDMWLEMLGILLGEVIVSLLTALVFYLISLINPSVKLDYTVPLGSLLGTFVTLLNYAILSIAVNRAIDKYIALRGTKEMDEEEAEKFAREHSSSVTLAAQGTYLFRMLLMVGVLVGAFLLKDVFNVFSTLVPILAFRPIVYVLEFIRKKTKKEV